MSDRTRTISRHEEVDQANGSRHSAPRDDDYVVSLSSINSSQVSDREVEVIELYLGHEIDRLLGPLRRPKARGPPD